MIVIQASPVSRSEVSTMPPWPVWSRSRNAARMPITDHIAAPMSMIEAVTLTGARPVAALRVLDLDHLGAELPEDHPGIGRGDRMADLDNHNSGQRTDGGHSTHHGGTRGYGAPASRRHAGPVDQNSRPAVLL